MEIIGGRVHENIRCPSCESLLEKNEKLKRDIAYREERIQAALRWAGATHQGGGMWRRDDGQLFMVLGCTDDPWEGVRNADER